MTKHYYNITNEDLHKTIWRYMDFAKFIDMLENKIIFFPKVDVFEDKLEGIHNALKAIDCYGITNEGALLKICAQDEINDIIKQDSEQFKEFYSNHLERLKDSSGINCWRISEEESHAMWKVFLSSNEGILIKSTLGQLYNSLSNSNDNTVLHYGMVNYINYATENIPINNVMAALFHKNIYFEHEKELRVVAYQVNDSNTNTFDCENFISIKGSGIEMDLNYQSLIEEIRISPYAPTWFFNLVKKIVMKYDLNIPVVSSIIQLRD